MNKEYIFAETKTENDMVNITLKFKTKTSLDESIRMKLEHEFEQRIESIREEFEQRIEEEREKALELYEDLYKNE